MTTTRKKRQIQREAIIKVFNRQQQRFTNVIIPSGITVGIEGDADFERGITLNGPLEFKTVTAPDATSLKLYVVGSDLYFNGVNLGAGEGGWTDAGSVVHTTTSTDKVGIGTDSPANKLQVDHTGADGDDGLMIVRADSSTADGNLLGGIGFDSTDGNVPSSITEAAAFIAAYAAETHGTSDKGGDLVFGTTTINENDDTTSNEWMRILDSGKVGIGLATPKTKLTVEGSFTLKEQSAADSDTAAYGQIWVKDDAPNTLYFTDDGGTDHQLGVGGGSGGWTDDGSVVRLTTATDSVGIGTTSPSYKLHVSTDTATEAEVGVTQYNNSTAADGPNLRLLRARGTEGSPSVVQVGDHLGSVFWYGHDGTNFEAAAAILCDVDGSPAGDSTDMPGRLTFCTTPDGSDTVIERVRINNTGSVGINTSTPGMSKLHVYNNATIGAIGSLNLANAGLRIQDSAYNMFIDGNTFNIDGPGHIDVMTNDYFKIATNDTTRMTVLGGGNVGIGTTGPDRVLDVLDASNPQLRLTHTDGSKFVDMQVDTNHDLTITPSSTGQVILQPTTDSTDFFQVLDADGGTPILNVDSINERVGIATSTPMNRVQIDHAGSNGDDGLLIIRADSSTADGDLLGGIGFDSTDGNVPSSITEASAFIAAYAAETHGTSDKGGDLVFGTTTINDNDDATSHEWMRILDSGKVGVGTSSPANRLQVDHSAADGDDGLMIVRADTTTADGDLLGGIGFDSTDGNVPSSITESAAFIAAYAAEAHSTGDKGGDLVFGTTTINDNDDITSHEWMRILDSGKVGIGTASPQTKLTVEGAVTLKEQSAADSDTAAYGQIWVKDDAPNTLYFTDDDGTDHQLGVTVTVTSGSFNVPSPSEFVTTSSVSIAGGEGFSYTADTIGTDVYFFVSGSQAAAGGDTPGVSVFGGDVVVSGSLGIDSLSSLSRGVLPITSSLVDIGWDPATAGTATGASLRLTSHDTAIDTSTTLGTVEFWGLDGGTGGGYAAGAKIIGAAKGIWSNNDNPAELQFYTTKDGTSSLTQHLTVTHDGRVARTDGGATPTSELEIVGFVGDDGVKDSTIMVVHGMMGSTSGSVAFRQDSNVTAAALVLEGGGDFVLVNSASNKDIIFKVNDGGTIRQPFKIDASEPSILFLSGGSAASPNESAYTDTNFFVSGSIGSKDSSMKGTSVFGGDVVASGSVYAGSIAPIADNIYDLGSASRRYANIYTGDLHLQNERGHWQIVEERDYLCVINRLTGKHYKMSLEPMDDEEQSR